MKTELIIDIACFALINLVLVLLGYIIVKKKHLLTGWALLIGSLIIIYSLFLNEHPVIRMLALIATTFTAMKPLAAIASYKNKPVMLTFKQWCAFAGGWVGMRPQPFETLGAPPLANAWPMVRFGIIRVIAGGLLILLAHMVVKLSLPYHFAYIIVTAMLLAGLSLILHFGLLSVSAGMWRFSGANTYLLFRQPATALSLSEFWGKRWNLAFVEMTTVTIFRPLKQKTGAGIALFASFIFSGFLHEIALSVPVNAGYGLPTLYFIIQAIVVSTEKHIPFLKNKMFAHIWVFFWLVVPVPLLFHEQFIKQIVWPIGGLN